MFEFIKYIWKDEDKTEEGMENIRIVTYNFLFPNGGMSLHTTWNQDKGHYWERKDGKKYYFEFKKKSIVIGKFSAEWSLTFDEKDAEIDQNEMVKQKH